MEVDHIVPRHRGGEMFALDNLQTLCQQCHIQKTKNDSIFLKQKRHPPYHVSIFSPKVAMVLRRDATRAIVGDSEAFGLGEAGE